MMVFRVFKGLSPFGEAIPLVFEVHFFEKAVTAGYLRVHRRGKHWWSFAGQSSEGHLD
jgi:hypothetical protein